MTSEYDLFSYPQKAGYKSGSTSKAAAESIDAGTLRAIVLDAIERCGPMTADEAAERLHMECWSVRPRFTELKVLGLIHDSGVRRRNQSGRMAKVMAITEGEVH